MGHPAGSVPRVTMHGASFPKGSLPGGTVHRASPPMGSVPRDTTHGGIPSPGVCAQGHHAHCWAGTRWPGCTTCTAAGNTWGSISANWGQGELCSAIRPTAGLTAPAVGWWEGCGPPLHHAQGQRARGHVPSVPAQRAVEERAGLTDGDFGGEGRRELPGEIPHTGHPRQRLCPCLPPDGCPAAAR